MSLVHARTPSYRAMLLPFGLGCWPELARTHALRTRAASHGLPSAAWLELGAVYVKQHGCAPPAHLPGPCILCVAAAGPSMQRVMPSRMWMHCMPLWPHALRICHAAERLCPRIQFHSIQASKRQSLQPKAVVQHQRLVFSIHAFPLLYTCMECTGGLNFTIHLGGRHGTAYAMP